MRSKTHVPQPAVTLPEEESYWCVASERKNRGQDLKHLNTTSGKTNDEGKKRGKGAQSGSFAWRKRFNEMFCCSSQHRSHINPKGESQSILALGPLCRCGVSACMHVNTLPYAFTLCRKRTCLENDKLKMLIPSAKLFGKKTMQVQLIAIFFSYFFIFSYFFRNYVFKVVQSVRDHFLLFMVYNLIPLLALEWD